MSKIYLIRHGQSIGNTKSGFISGQSDPDGLTTTGISQVAKTAHLLYSRRLDHIFTSPVARAVQTAQIISNLTNTPLSKRMSLSELNYGSFERRYWWDVHGLVGPDWIHQIRTDPTTTYPDGESIFDMAARGIATFKNLQKHNKSYAIISHDALIGSILYYLKFSDPQPNQAFLDFLHQARIPNASVMVYDQKTNKTSQLDIPDHLPPTLTTITRYLTAHIPDAKIDDLHHQYSTSANQVYQTKPSPYIFKLMHQADRIPTTKLTQLYRYLDSDTSIPAPKLIVSDSSQEYFDATILVQDYKVGKTYHECLTHTHTHSTQLQTAIEILDHIHQIPPKEVQNFWIQDQDDRSSWSSWMTHHISRVSDFITASDIPTKDAILMHLTMLKAYVSSDQYPLVPLHGDFSPHNLIVSPDSCAIIRVLDFDRARLGDVLWDYAYFHGWLMRSAPQTAHIWHQMILSRLPENKHILYTCFTSLFHAWSFQDGLDYPDDPQRQEAATASKEILLSMAY